MPHYYPRTGRGKQEMLEAVVESLNKKYRKTKREISVSLLESSNFNRPKAYVPSGILPIDLVVSTRGQGFPAGIVEIFGPEHSGKSAILEHVFAESQRLGYHTILFPMEFSIDYDRMRSVGISSSELLIGDVDSIEDVHDQIRATVSEIRSRDADTPIVVGIDTIAATPTRTELEHKEGLAASDMGKAALQLSKFFRRNTGFLYRKKVCLFLINQTRVNIGQMYGSKETTYGGKAMKFYTWVRCRTQIRKLLKDEEQEIGQLCTFKVVKNKVAPPYRSCILPIYWDRGIDKVEAVWLYAIDKGIIERKGTTYRWKGKVVTKRRFPELYRKNRKDINRALREVR